MQVLRPDKVIRQQGVQTVGVGVQFGVIECLQEFADVSCHVTVLSRVESSRFTLPEALMAVCFTS